MSIKKTLLKTAFLGTCSVLGLGLGVSILDRYEEAHKPKDGAIDAKFEVSDDETINETENTEECSTEKSVD